MWKLLAALVCQEVFYQTILVTTVTQHLGNIASWDENMFCQSGAQPEILIGVGANNIQVSTL